MGPYRFKARLKGIIRRQANRFLPGRDARQYATWMKSHLAYRRAQSTSSPEPGLLSICTAVWNGSPVPHLKALARSIGVGNPSGACEWVILDNGVTHEKLHATLSALRKYPWVKLFRSERNVGILQGLRFCLERASGRYILPVDADDRLYPDALSLISSTILDQEFPALLYTDEDKIIGNRIFDPYLKPDWDSVLLLNSAYIAHLGVLDRRTALDLDAYTDSATEGSPDWDAFVRFHVAGYSAVHIPEVVYSWRVHPHSTADDEISKPYVHSSQRAVLQRYIDSRHAPSDFVVENSPLFSGGAHFHIATRSKASSHPASTAVNSDDSLASFSRFIAGLPNALPYIFLNGIDVTVVDPGLLEIQQVFDLHPDTVMIGGRIWNSRQEIVEAGQVLGFDGICGCPFGGYAAIDPGYFGQLWKRRSVSAVSAQLCAINLDFLRAVRPSLPHEASLSLLGAWLGAAALRAGKRVVYTPYLAGKSEATWNARASAGERALFRDRNRDLLPDRRYYPKYFSLEVPFRLEKYPQ